MVNLLSFWKFEACSQTVLPDPSILMRPEIGRKFENWNINETFLGDFQTMRDGVYKIMRHFPTFFNSVLFCSIFKSHFVEACLLILTSNKKWSSITGWIQFRISMHNPIMELYLYAKRQIENVKGPRDLTEKWTWWSLRNAKTCREPLVKTFCLYTENNQTTSQSKRKLRSKQTDSLITTTNVQHLQGVQASLE